MVTPLIKESLYFNHPEGYKLKGVFNHNLSSSDCVVLVHGFTSNKTEYGRFNIANNRFLDKGYSTLMFDFSGCGESEPCPISMKRWMQDFRSAMLLAKEHYERSHVFSLCLGSYIASQNSDLANSIALLAPMNRPRDLTLEIPPDNLEMLAKVGYYERHKPYAPDPHKHWKISLEYVQARKIVTPLDYTNMIKPAIVIQGYKDVTVTPKQTRKLFRCIPKGSIRKVIRGADHLFEKHMDLCAQMASEWYKRNDQ